jgi:hypothetical protein
MQTLCEDLKANTPQLLRLWEQALQHEPWILPRQHARPDFVPELIAVIADTILCAPPTRSSVLALANVAAAHASRRAMLGVDHSRVVLEYYILRNAVWTYFREGEGGEHGELQAILFLDVAISMATRAALLGYYRRELEAEGRWEGALDRLVDETPLMWVKKQRA